MMKIEMDVWMDIARADFVDERFSKSIMANKAYNLFQNSVADFDEHSYRTQAAILNGLLTHHLDASSCGNFVDLRRIAFLLDHFDKLVLCSECLRNESAGIELLQCLVKCSFYSRLADFMLCVSTCQQTFDGLRLSAMAMFCYGLALNWARRKLGNSDGGTDAALISLCAAELLTLLKANLQMSVGGDQLEAEIHSCNRNMVLSFLRCYSSSDSAHFDTSSVTSFLQTDQSKLVALSELSFDELPHLVANAWPLRRNVHFLRRLASILAHCPVTNFHRVLDPLLQRGLSSCFAQEDALLSCSPESITTFDVKIFFVRLSSHMKLCTKTATAGDFVSVFPWLFHYAPNAQQQQFWSNVLSLLSGQQKMNLSTLLSITNALEQIRFVDASGSPSSWSTSRDVSHLAETMQILETLADLTKNNDEKQMLYWTAERCATAAKVALDGIHFPTEATTDDELKSDEQLKTLFPPLNHRTLSEPIDDGVVEKIERFFLNKMERQTKNARENSSTESEQVTTEQSEAPEMEQQQKLVPHRTAESTTQTEEGIKFEEAAKADQNKAFSEELESINSLVTRLTIRNRSLSKLFTLGPNASMNA